MNLVSLSLCFALIPPTKFRFNPSLNFGEDNVTLLCVLWRLSWKAEWNNYCNSESQYGLDAYHKVLNVAYVIFTSSGWLPWRYDILDIRKEQF